jgi:hypothetical protein
MLAAAIAAIMGTCTSTGMSLSASTSAARFFAELFSFFFEELRLLLSRSALCRQLVVSL